MTKEHNELIDNTFKQLQKYDNILAYDSEDVHMEKLSTLVNGEYILVDLRVSEMLKNKFLSFYDVRELPCYISYGVRIYDDDDFEENVKKSLENEGKFLENKIKNIIETDKITIFIKGTPLRPECGFTRQLIEIFDEFNFICGKDYVYFNIFSDNRVRERLKVVNKWPTFPQIYVKEEFIGGLDVLKKMKKTGEFQRKINFNI
ncbi:putative glutaredoxin [Hamiltosporidium tvaerminnensis]|uniref:Putative glutaredoxin n=1 Tax=Hamiltosporidium tvaerminnensis TaxID=1176355 RepID=A0A4Q9M418_9MICR|nr:putative glutaredoxin [Hamiltosporidium tvaerminnensis]